MSIKSLEAVAWRNRGGDRGVEEIEEGRRSRRGGD
jgi:hypothetical protein